MPLSQRLRAVAGDARLAVGATIGVLMVLVAVVGLGIVVATRDLGEVTAIVLLSALLLMGAYVVADALHQAGQQEPRAEVVVTEGIYGRTVPLPEPTGPRPKAWKAVVAVLVLLVTVPLGLAVVMSQLDDHLRGHPLLGTVVVTVLVTLITLLVRVVVGRTTTRRR